MANLFFSSPGPDGNHIRRRIIWTWIQTLASLLFMGSLVAGALVYFGLTWSFGAGILALWMLLPIAGWFYSDRIVKRLAQCQEPSQMNLNHQRLVRIVEGLYPRTGLRVKPPVYVSPLLIPNAFATGRTPGNSFIAATEGLLLLNLTDEELEAVLAHELAHVANYDVSINSLLAVMGSFFSLIIAVALPGFFNLSLLSSKAPMLEKISQEVKHKKQNFFLPAGGVVSFFSMLIIFFLVGTAAKIITLFVSRVRESAADVHACRWTGNPCALASALQKIVIFMQLHALDLRQLVLTGGMLPILFLSPIEGIEDKALNTRSIWQKLRLRWRRLGEAHPPLQERIELLDKLNGDSCPRLP